MCDWALVASELGNSFSLNIKSTGVGERGRGMDALQPSGSKCLLSMWWTGKVWPQAFRALVV